MIDIWRHAIRSIREGRHTAMVIVVESAGSVPGTPGTKIVVSELGDVGTIGGGIAELELVERARTHRGGPVLVPFVHSGDSGSVCAGSQTFAVVELGEADSQWLEQTVATLEDSTGRGMLTLSPTGLRIAPGETGPLSFVRDGDAWTYSETLGRLDTLTIIGGGHVSLALSRVTSTLPFRVVVIDNRPQVPTMLHNRWAHSTRVVDYAEVRDHVPQGDRSWVVIMTHGHAHDEAVLEELVDGSYRYLGLLGSTSKVAHLFGNLADRGAARQHLDRVHAPVGLPIGSHTPEEIAISIAAEIVRMRNIG